MPEEFMNFHVRAVVADPLDTTASTTWFCVVDQRRTSPQARRRRVFAGPMESNPTLIPWKNGRCVTWDVTLTDTNLPVTSGSSGAAKMAKFGQLACHTLSYQLR